MSSDKSKLDQHVSGQSNQPMSKPAHSLEWRDVASELKADTDDGLSRDEAGRRLAEYGRNELGDAKPVRPGKILVRQMANAMTLVLIIAMVVSFAIKSWIEGGVITAVIFLNIAVGFYQEYQAEKTMSSLRSLSSPTANVVRNGTSTSIPTAEVVPGDLVELKTGDTIPADIRLTEAMNFETDEALLTGESLPVRKSAGEVFAPTTGPGGRLNVAYSSSVVTKGRATGVAFATGMYTEIGSIAAALQKKDRKTRQVKRREDGTARPHRYVEAAALTMYDAVGAFLGINIGTPLQKKLSRLAILLFFIAVVCAIIVLGANEFRNRQEVIIYAVATGLSMIPASLVVVLTIAMAAGTKRMVERNVIVRNLRSLEALGGVTDICSDKTGTLTQGKMVAKKAWLPSVGTFTVGEIDEPFNPTKGNMSFTKHDPTDASDKDLPAVDWSNEEALQRESLQAYLRVASLANVANVHQTENREWHARGDPTEIAIKVLSARFAHNGVTVPKHGDTWELLAEFPFDSDVKRMSVISREIATEQTHVLTKGAVERVLASCSHITTSTDPTPITDTHKGTILANMESLASLGLRVLAFAHRSLPTSASTSTPDRAEIERDLTFLGLIGLYDPPRPESAPSVRQCHEAGIEVHMLTGDHPGTARAIASQVGILPANMSTVSRPVADAMVMTATQFDALSDDQIDTLPVLPLVIARCAPNTKVRMIAALHRRGRFCAMTGDGVNDSPSLKRADVGIAMGQTGSDVAKDAADIILTDDNFASILAAVEEGRRTFDNIQKFALHLLAQNVSQALVLLLGLVFKDAERISVFPLAPIEILWIIMITSGLPDMGLAFEPATPGILRRPPHSIKAGIFTWEICLDMLVYGVWIAALCLASWSLVLYGWGSGEIGFRCNESIGDGCEEVFRARATCFATVTWMSLFLAWEVVDSRRSFFAMQPAELATGERAKEQGGKAVPPRYMHWVLVVWRNHFLFWSVIAGFVTIFPVLYIPVINDVVFKHTGISWEWGIVFVASGLFFAGVEFWKWCKRVWLRRNKAKGRGRNASITGEDVQEKVFRRYLTESSMGSEPKETV